MRTDHITADQWPQYLQELLTTDERADYSVEIDRWHTFLEMEVLSAFDRQSSPEGQGWAPWEWRALRYHGEQRALINSGRLYESFVRKTPENVDEVGPKTGKYGSANPYAAIHQFGEVARPEEDLYRRGTYQKLLRSVIDVPARPMLGVRDDMEETFTESIADSLVQQMKG